MEPDRREQFVLVAKHSVNQILSEFEKDLNLICFEGMPLGVMLSNELCVQLLLNKDRLSLGDFPRVLLQALRASLLFSPGTSFVSGKSIPEKYALLTSISPNQNYLEQVKGISQILEEKWTIRYLVHKTDAKMLCTSADKIIKRKRATGKYCIKWFRSFRRIVFPLWSTIQKRKDHFGFVELINLFVSCMIQTQKAYYARDFLNMHRPQFILTEYDKNSEMVNVISAAKSLGIPTFSLLHGLVTHYEPYIPLLADRLFVWGDFFKSYLIKGGLTDEQIETTGAAHIYPIESDIAYLDREYLTLATNPFNTKLVNSMIVMLGKASNLLYNVYPKMKVMVRIHPSENIEDYRNLSIEFPNIFFDNGRKFMFEESIKVSRIILTLNSAYGIDGLMKGRKIIQLGKPEGTDFFTEMVDSFAIPRANTATELFEIIRDNWENKGDSNSDLVYKLCKVMGGDAARLTAKKIQDNLIFSNG